MNSRLLIKAEECSVYIASPVEHEECVVLVEGKTGALFMVTDESRSGRCLAEFAKSEENRTAWSMTLADLRTILDKAERLLASQEN